MPMTSALYSNICWRFIFFLTTLVLMSVVSQRPEALARDHVTSYRQAEWENLHISNNAPYLPPKVCVSIVFIFSWDGCNTQEKWKTTEFKSSLQRDSVMNKYSNNFLAISNTFDFSKIDIHFLSWFLSSEHAETS